MIYIVLASIFVSTSMILWQLSYWTTKNARTLQARLQAALSEPAGTLGQARPAGQAWQADAARQAGQTARGFLGGGSHPGARRRLRLPALSLPGRIMGRRYMERLRSDLVKSGLPLRAEEIVGLDVLSGVIGFTIGILLFRKLPLAILTGILAFILPEIWVQRAKRRRASKVEAQLLDGLVVIASALRAGHSFIQALEIVSQELAPPLSLEFGKVMRESRVGLPIDEALANLVKRVDSKDLELVVTGVLIQRQVGGNLAQVLDNIGDTISKRIKMRARVRVLTAQGRMSAWVVSLLPFFLAAFIFGMYPDFGRIMLVSPIGVGMLVAGAILLFIGIMLIRKLVNVDV